MQPHPPTDNALGNAGGSIERWRYNGEIGWIVHRDPASIPLRIAVPLIFDDVWYADFFS